MPSLVRLFMLLMLTLCSAWVLTAATQEIRLQAPLTTVVRVAGDLPSGDLTVRATVQVPTNAPADLGVGAFVADRHGRWFQRVLASPLRAGTNDLVFAMGSAEPLVGQPHHGVWNAATAARITQAGLFFWSPTATGMVLHIDDVRAEATAAEVPLDQAPRLTGIDLPGMSAGTIRVRSGARYELSLTPTPFPSNPYDPLEFSLDAVFTHADGRTMRVPGFACEPMALSDRGDLEQATADGALRFLVRWRAPLAGAWRGRLEARWHGGEPLTVDLPPIVVEGGDHDEVVRVDADDPRFFSVNGRWFWPIGMNLHSTFDVRSRDRLSTVLTPPRGTLAYADRFKRLAAAGGNATEIWMGSWNLALEWNAGWPGYAGMGRYSQENAARLDVVLDAALANGIRINLVINNHGQASPDNDREWKDHPWNRVNGGLLNEPYELFTDARSLTGQAHLRRYLVARYADHPAILGWKLWSEINLTALGEVGRRSRAVAGAASVSSAQRLATLVSWHDGAATHVNAIDAYRHPVTTHWSSDYRKPNPEVCALPSLQYLCIDAYHSGRATYRGSTLVDLIWNGTQDPIRGLGRFKKPVLVTEFGGSSGGATNELLEAELASAPWAAALSGNAGMPFMWWFEWIDQRGQWLPFRAIAQFLGGEDLRGTDARAVALNVTGDTQAWWARAWVRPGRMLGYIADHRWTGEGGKFPRRSGVAVRVGSQVAPGPCRIEWWDATTGIRIGVQEYEHPGGALDLHAPEFLHHVAFKLIRSSAERQAAR